MGLTFTPCAPFVKALICPINHKILSISPPRNALALSASHPLPVVQIGASSFFQEAAFSFTPEKLGNLLS